MSAFKSDCEPNRDSEITGGIDEHGLCSLYAAAVSHYERATMQVDEMIAAVENGAECEAQSVALRAVCAEIALVERRILAANQRLSSAQQPAGPLLIAAADRHLKALAQLCDRVRAAEHAAAQRLLSLAPRLDTSIRGKAMVSAYRQHRAS